MGVNSENKKNKKINTKQLLQLRAHLLHGGEVREDGLIGLILHIEDENRCICVFCFSVLVFFFVFDLSNQRTIKF